MERRKVTARDVLNDIRAGASDRALMEKYSLSAQGLQSAFEKLLKAGAITRAELDDRVPISERTVDFGGLFICPACGNIQNTEFKICPRCGFEAPSQPAKSTTKPPSGQVWARSTKTALRTDTVPPPAASEPVGPPLSGNPPIAALVAELNRITGYCHAFGIVALVSYVLLIGGMISVFQGPSSGGAGAVAQLSGIAIALGLPAVLVVFIVFATLRALTECVRILSGSDIARCGHAEACVPASPLIGPPKRHPGDRLCGT